MSQRERRRCGDWAEAGVWEKGDLEKGADKRHFGVVYRDLCKSTNFRFQDEVFFGREAICPSLSSIIHEERRAFIY